MPPNGVVSPPSFAPLLPPSVPGEDDLAVLDAHFTLNSYCVGYCPSTWDFRLEERIAGAGVDVTRLPHLERWRRHLRSFGPEEREELIKADLDLESRVRGDTLRNLNHPPRHILQYPLPFLSTRLSIVASSKVSSLFSVLNSLRDEMRVLRGFLPGTEVVGRRWLGRGLARSAVVSSKQEVIVIAGGTFGDALHCMISP